MKNPFVYGEVVVGDYFCNREKEIGKLTRDVLDSQKIFLISSRRYGKTSLIKTVIEKIRKKKIKTIYLDIEGASTYRKFLNAYLTTLAKEYTMPDKIFEFIRCFFPGVELNLSVDEAGNPGLSIGYKSQDPDFEKIASKIYKLPEKIVGKDKMVIVFDEFQEILKLNGNKIEAAMRSAIQNQRNVGYIFAGSKKHTIADMVTSPKRPFYKIGPIMNLEKIPEKEFKKFVKSKFRETNISITEDSIKKIFEISENIPYCVQMISHELWDYAIANQKMIEEKHIDMVLKELVNQYDPIFRESWDKIVSTKKQILQIIVLKGGHNLLSKKSLNESELSYPSSAQRAIELLIDDGYIDKVDGEYYIVDILFREWIKRVTS